MRSLCDDSNSILQALSARHQTAHELSEVLSINERALSWKLRNLRSAGHVQVVEKSRQPWAKRPVACYGLRPSKQKQQSSFLLQSVFSARVSA